MNNTNAISKRQLSVKTQTLATLTAIIAAVALPQICHLMGAMSGLGTALGEIFLPMHLPIILVGLLAGPYAGAIAGAIAPAVSFALTGMPSALMLLFMMLELCVYGLSGGLLRNIKLPTTLKVIASQLAGRAVRAVAILLAVFAFGNTAINVATIWNSILTGIFGIVLQLVLLPLVVYRIENFSKNDN